MLLLLLIFDVIVSFIWVFWRGFPGWLVFLIWLVVFPMCLVFSLVFLLRSVFSFLLIFAVIRASGSSSRSSSIFFKPKTQGVVGTDADFKPESIKLTLSWKSGLASSGLCLIRWFVSSSDKFPGVVCCFFKPEFLFFLPEDNFLCIKLGFCRFSVGVGILMEDNTQVLVWTRLQLFRLK